VVVLPWAPVVRCRSVLLGNPTARPLPESPLVQTAESLIDAAKITIWLWGSNVSRSFPPLPVPEPTVHDARSQDFHTGNPAPPISRKALPKTDPPPMPALLLAAGRTAFISPLAGATPGCASAFALQRPPTLREGCSLAGALTPCLPDGPQQAPARVESLQVIQRVRWKGGRGLLRLDFQRKHHQAPVRRWWRRFRAHPGPITTPIYPNTTAA